MQGPWPLGNRLPVSPWFLFLFKSNRLRLKKKLPSKSKKLANFRICSFFFLTKRRLKYSRLASCLGRWVARASTSVDRCRGLCGRSWATLTGFIIRSSSFRNGTAGSCSKTNPGASPTGRRPGAWRTSSALHPTWPTGYLLCPPLAFGLTWLFGRCHFFKDSFKIQSLEYYYYLFLLLWFEFSLNSIWAYWLTGIGQLLQWLINRELIYG